MTRTFSWALGALMSVAAATPVLAQDYQQPPPQYQQPPPQYQQAPPQYQQAPPPQYQQQPPPQYQQQPPPQYQQAPPPQYQQQPPPNYQQPPPPPYYQQPPPQTPYQQQPNAQQAAAQPAQHVYVTRTPGFQYHALRFQLEGGYTLTDGDTKQSFNNGGNVGAGLTWFPSPSLPLGFRFDGSYSRFDASLQQLQNVSNATNTNVSYGHMDVYGGDADAEIDLSMGPKVREYFFGGIGWYKQHQEYYQTQWQYGTICYFYCYPGYFPVTSQVGRATTDWMRAWNAGIGFEFWLQGRTSFFVEARYMRFEPSNTNSVFIPIRVGLRF